MVQFDELLFNKIAIQGAPQVAVDKEAISLSRVYRWILPKFCFNNKAIALLWAVSSRQNTVR